MFDSLLTLYRIICQPTSFAAQTRHLRFRQRLVFMLRMAPIMLISAAATVGSLSLLLHIVGLPFHWAPKVPWWAPSMISVAAGVACGTLWNVSLGVAAGVVWGPAQWVVAGVMLPMFAYFMPGLREVARGGAPGMREAVTLGSPLGLALGVGLGVALGRVKGALWGVPLGLVFALGTAPGGRVFSLPAVVPFLVPFLFGYFRLEWYALDVEVTLWQLWRARARPQYARLLFRRCPIYWREPIWLPLLGLRSFLRLIGESDYRAGVEECLFVISERPTQARLGRAALLELGATHLAQLGTVQEVASAVTELEAASGAGVIMPGPLAEALPSLEVLSRYAEQHLSATLPHNRRRALERLREGADELSRKLALAQGGLARILVAAARRWREVAEARLAEMDRVEAEAGFVHNPFVFGQPIEETETNLFVGRRDVVRQIEVSLLGGTAKPALVLWGPRRMGKTSVLLQLPRLLGSEFVPAFIDMQAMQVRESLPAFFRALTEASSAALRRRGLEVPPLQLSELADSPFTTFADWITRLEQKLGGRRYLLLCLDEFERLETSIREDKLPRELMDQIRHLIQHHPRVVVLVSGSHRPDEMELNWSDTLISTKLIEVSYLGEEEARQLITQPVPRFEVQYRPESVDDIVSLTRCQPYLVQALCFELVNLLNVAGRREALREDVEQALQQGLDSTRLYFAEMWRQLGEGQQRLLRLIASQPLTAPELVEASGREGAEVEADLRLLETRSIIEKQAETDRWRFQVPMVGMWVKTRTG